MNAQRYEMTLRQGDLLVELESTDQDFIARQMKRWMEVVTPSAAKSVKRPKRNRYLERKARRAREASRQEVQDSVVHEPEAQSPIPQAIESSPAPTPVPAPVAVPVEAEVPQTVDAAPVEPIESLPMTTDDVLEASQRLRRGNPLADDDEQEEVASTPVVPDLPEPTPVEPEEQFIQERPPIVEASTGRITPPVTRVVTPQPVEVPLTQEVTPQVIDPSQSTAVLTQQATEEALNRPEQPNDSVEQMVNAVLQDMGEEGTPVATPAPVEVSGEADSPDSFEVIESLPDLVKKTAANTPNELLMLACYFLTYFDGEAKFTLKRINSLMMQSSLQPVNHSVLETALSLGNLSIVPDLTGLADITEYQLSDQGQQFTEGLLED